MSAKKIWLTLLLGLMALLLIAGCQGKKGPEKSTGNDSETVAPLVIAENGKSAFAIVRGDNAGKAVQEAASNLWKTIGEKTGVKDIEIYDEFRYAENGKPAAIVVGLTSDEISVRLHTGLLTDDYLIHAENGNLYIVGGSDDATVTAVNWFIENYLKESVTSLVLEGGFELKYTKEYPVQKLTVDGTEISSFRIVYDADLYYSKACAEELRNLIVETCGVTVEVVPDTKPAVEKEILVGATNRTESETVIGEFDRPNYYYAAKVIGSKVVVANQGYRTGEAVMEAIKANFKKLKGTGDLTAANFTLEGNVGAVDGLPRQEGTNVRVMQSNVMGTTLATQPKAEGYTEQMCCELLADTYLLYFPDVITFNEMTPYSKMKPGITKLIEQYYTFADAKWLGIVDDGKPADAARTYNMPIAYRKDAGLTAVESGFSYHSDLIDYHGTAWTVFDSTDGTRFLVASNHLSKNQTESGSNITTWVEDALKTVEVALERYGDLPVVLCGDWFSGQTYYPHAYNYLIKQEYLDVSEIAETKYSVGIGTYHAIGLEQLNRVEEDIIFIKPSARFKVLSHKNIVDFCTVFSSDHYPVLSDLKFLEKVPKTTLDVANEGDPRKVQFTEFGFF